MKSEIKPISGVDDRVRLAEAVPLDSPFTMNIFPTNACNFRCNYCAQSLGAETLRRRYGFTCENMKLGTLAKAVEQMREMPCPFKLVSFMGHGEPLLHKQLPEMIRLVHEAGVAKRIEIISNGSMLTHELSEKLIEAGLSALRISLQGLSTESYMNVSRVNLDFAVFLAELKYFYSIRGNCKLYVKTVDVSLNDGEEGLFYATFADCTDRMYIEKIKPVYDGVAYAEDVQSVSVDRYGNEHVQRMVCPMPFYSLSLWPDGDVVPCDAIYKPIVLGNVHDATLLDMWQGKRLREFQQMQLRKKRLSAPPCDVCCAPDDVAHPLDSLDEEADNLLSKL